MSSMWGKWKEEFIISSAKMRLIKMWNVAPWWKKLLWRIEYWAEKKPPQSKTSRKKP